MIEIAYLFPHQLLPYQNHNQYYNHNRFPYFDHHNILKIHNHHQKLSENQDVSGYTVFVQNLAYQLKLETYYVSHHQ